MRQCSNGAFGSARQSFRGKSRAVKSETKNQTEHILLNCGAYQQCVNQRHSRRRFRRAIEHHSHFCRSAGLLEDRMM